MTKEEIEQEEQRIRIADAGEEYRKQFDNLPAVRFNAFCAGANWALQSENESLKAELLGNTEQLKAESKLTEYKLLAGEACFETLSKVNDAWPDVSEMEWISVETELPEIGEHVEVITEYVNKGKPDSSRFIGYMDECGDLVSIPEDENYGWQFNECVTLWRYLDEPKPPKQ